MAACRQCPIRDNCWDKDNCDECAIAIKINKMQNKITRLQNRLSKKEAELEIYRGFKGCRLHQIEDAELQGRLLILDTPEKKREIEAMITEGMKAMDKWISVDERLPEDDHRVLVACRTKKGVQAVNLAYYWNGTWHGQGSMAGVTHWMPLPPVPEVKT